MSTLRQSMKQLADRVDVLSLRERAILFLGILVVPIVIAANFLFVPLRTEQLNLEGQITRQLHESQTLDRHSSALLSGRMTDPNAAARAQISLLERQLHAQRGTLLTVTQGLVSPTEMARLVHALLAKNHGLQLVSIENLPPQPLGGELSGDAATGAQAERIPPALPSPQALPVQASGGAAAPVLYLHGMRVVLKGRYFDIVRYLQSMEALRWKMYWGGLRLKTLRYPESEVTLVIYTLGFNRAWIGM